MYLVGVALKLKCVAQTSLITISFPCISHSFYFNSYLKQLYISNKMKPFCNEALLCETLSIYNNSWI